MAVPFAVPRTQLRAHRISFFKVQQQSLKLIWNIYRFPQGFFTRRRKYPRLAQQDRADKPLTEIPKHTWQQAKFDFRNVVCLVASKRITKFHLKVTRKTAFPHNFIFKFLASVKKVCFVEKVVLQFLFIIVRDHNEISFDRFVPCDVRSFRKRTALPKMRWWIFVHRMHLQEKSKLERLYINMQTISILLWPEILDMYHWTW